MSRTITLPFKASMTLLAAMLLAGALSACAKRAATPTVSDAPSGATVAAQGTAADPEAAAVDAKAAAVAAKAAEDGARRMQAYKGVLLPVLAGGYGGDCTRSSGAKSHATVAIAADGSIATAGMPSHSLMEKDIMLMLMQKTGGGKPAEPSFVAGSIVDNGWHFSLTRRNGNTTRFSDKDDVLQCADEAAPAAARPASLYPLVAPIFSAAPRAMKCSDGTATLATFTITPQPTSVTIGSDRFELVRAQMDETIAIDAKEKSFVYKLETDDDGMVLMALDEAGRMKVFSATGKNKRIYLCSEQMQ